MNHRVFFLAFLVAMAMIVPAATAGAQDTSPYLAGFWSEDYHWFRIVNPTTKPLTVYAILYNIYYGLYQGIQCHRTGLLPNGTESWEFMSFAKGEFGTAKFFAFPLGTRKFDPNAVIGGFQRKRYEDVFNQRGYWLESNLKAVTINSYTIGEFSMIPPDDDVCFIWD
jgi:hypothetical protein